ncbi:MAG TPA: ectonucleotide pyrophosphatase/phosphodiesterase [Chitinophagaceae bacterium]|nr:ectonucleotide pyrophosphatase/phosphodiesterase [Chitinophagaceae bacterium]
MKSYIIFFFVFCVSIFEAVHAQPSKHVVLITIDGLRPEFYLDPSWGMVNLNIMKDEGVYAKGVNSVFPSLTLPAHTSLVTGLNPDKHGIYYNAPFRPTRNSNEWYWYYKDISTPTLWSIMEKEGMKTASVNWPVTIDAPIDYNIPVIKKKGQTQVETVKPYSTPAGLFEEVEREATGRLEDAEFSKIKDYIMQDQIMARIGAYLIREYKPAFTTIHLSVVDHFEHSEGRDGDMVRRAVSGVDRDIRTIVESIKRAGIEKNTTIIITGDHGHVNKHTIINPNVWLSEAGLIKDVKNDDWEAQFQVAGGSAFLYLKNPEDTITLTKVKNILKGLPKSERKFFRLINKKSLLDKGGDPNAVLALSTINGYAFGGAWTGDVYKPTHGATHGHFPDFKEIQTGFIAYGAGIRPGKYIDEMNLTDITPMIAYLLGLDFPSADGTLIRGVLK